METRVELRVQGKITPKIEKQARSLTEANTPDKEGIEVRKDKIDDSLLIIRFNSYPGKTSELADKIMKSYSLYLDDYSDIAVMFKTTRNRLDRTTDGTTKEEVIETISAFYRLFDDKDWGQLQSLLLDNIDYSEFQERTIFRSRIGKRISSKSYLSRKEKSLQGAITKHELTKLNLSKRMGLIVCEVDYSVRIARSDGGKERLLKGKQEFGIVAIAGELKISEIAEGRKNWKAPLP
jgi:hypothetical protein